MAHHVNQGEAAPVAQQLVQVVLPGGPDLRLNPFELPDDPLQVGKAWEEWLEDFEESADYHGVQATKKLQALKQYCGREVKKLLRSLPDPNREDNETDYELQTRKLNAHYVPKKNKHYARYLFNELKQKKDESVINYTARMREKARYCDFGEQEDERILEHLIQTIENKDLVRKSITKRWTLHQLLEEAGQYESTNMELA